MSLANSPTSTGATTAALSPAAFTVNNTPHATPNPGIFEQFTPAQTPSNAQAITPPPYTPHGGLGVTLTPNGGIPQTQLPIWQQTLQDMGAGIFAPGQVGAAAGQAVGAAAQGAGNFLKSGVAAASSLGSMLLIGLGLIAVIELTKK